MFEKPSHNYIACLNELIHLKKGSKIKLDIIGTYVITNGFKVRVNHNLSESYIDIPVTNMNEEIVKKIVEQKYLNCVVLDIAENTHTFMFTFICEELNNIPIRMWFRSELFR